VAVTAPASGTLQATIKFAVAASTTDMDFVIVAPDREWMWSLPAGAGEARGSLVVAADRRYELWLFSYRDDAQPFELSTALAAN
jgi:hypothetical protein